MIEGKGGLQLVLNKNPNNKTLILQQPPNTYTTGQKLFKTFASLWQAVGESLSNSKFPHFNLETIFKGTPKMWLTVCDPTSQSYKPNVCNQ